MNTYIIAALGLVAGFVIALVIYLIQRNSAFRMVAHSKEIVEEIKSNAKAEAETLKKSAMLEAKEEWFKQ
ncbi:MAG TPA: Rnase Y domain-containing protein, partial [Candidatus Cloacimonadota bacterium]|nr:Rnase Y domain-containing protein [Candidatus Cloacimonadota bacterium]